MSALILASAYGQTEVAVVLLEHGATVDLQADVSELESELFICSSHVTMSSSKHAYSLV